MIAELHRDMQCQVTVNGILSDEIPIENGVKQGDILAPTLFSIYFSVLLSYAFENCEAGVYMVAFVLQVPSSTYLGLKPKPKRLLH